MLVSAGTVSFYLGIASICWQSDSVYPPQDVAFTSKRVMGLGHQII